MEYYKFILYIVFGMLPSLAWLFYYLRQDLHPEPKRMILKVFFYGMLAAVPIFFAELILSNVLHYLQSVGTFKALPWAVAILNWFIVIAFTEELFKYLVVRFTALKSKELDEPLDLMLYMVVAALGFAALENMFYLFSPIDGLDFTRFIFITATITIIRFLGGTFLHTLCSALLGYFLALASIRAKSRILFTVIGLALATLLHGLYDFSIMTLSSPFSVIVPIAIVAGLSVFMVIDFNEVKKIKSIYKLN